MPPDRSDSGGRGFLYFQDWPNRDIYSPRAACSRLSFPAELGEQQLGVRRDQLTSAEPSPGEITGALFSLRTPA
jgi:hypothetical protein